MSSNRVGSADQKRSRRWVNFLSASRVNSRERQGYLGLEEAEASLRTSFTGKRVLVVEDDTLGRELCHSLLVEAKLDVDTAENGLVALKKASGQRFDLVIMDLQMPRMGGLEATQRIRALPGYANVPIVALTASAFGEDRTQALAAGMDDFVTKPMEPHTLFRVILRWLEKGSR